MAYTSAKNATQNLSILLRNGTHAGASLRFAMKADSFSVSYSKTPIQVPIPETSPELIDLGIFRPSISLNGVVDTVQPTPASITIGGQTYYIPFKNWLEDVVYTWIASDSANGQLELEVGDTSYPQTDSSTKGYTGTPIEINTDSSALSSWTGGAVYRVAIQMARFQLNPSREDRYDCSMQFVASARQDWVDRADLD
jgi:hypothetical protein